MLWKRWRTGKKDLDEASRVQADLAVAMGFLNLRREILLVVKNGKLTVPTGHMDPRVDKDPADTLRRESVEELWKNSQKELEGDSLYRITARLGTTPRNLDDPAKTKSFDIFICRLTPKAAALADFEEKGQKGQVYVKPPTEEELQYLSPSGIIDGLALEVLSRYARAFLSHRKGGKNESAGKNFIQEVEEPAGS
ncbi:NUDIX hydrolase [Patescibacteria group bacterium]|nr:NUDIX hydrolase [Patescibacteria group bacterium]